LQLTFYNSNENQPFELQPFYIDEEILV